MRQHLVCRHIPYRLGTLACQLILCVAGLAALVLVGSEATAQQSPAEKVRRGRLIEIPIPIRDREAAALIATLDPIVEAAEGDLVRPTVVLRLMNPTAGDAREGETAFEEALRLARALTTDRWRSVRLIVWLDTVVDDHSALLLTVGEQILMSDLARIERLGDVNDDTFALNYAALAKRRSVLPAALVQTLASPVETLSRVTLADGSDRLVAGEEFETLRQSGQIIKTEIWTDTTKPLSLGGEQLRDAGIVSGLADTVEEVAQRLDLASLSRVDRRGDGEIVAARLDISGPIAGSRTRRFQANLAGISSDVNTLLITIDSTGGRPQASSQLAASLVDPPAGVSRTIGVVTGEALGDAAILAVACKPLYMLPDAKLGGSGGGSFASGRGVDDELVNLISKRTGRSSGLIVGLLQQQNIHRFTDRRTGAIAYGPLERILAGADDPDAEADRWVRGDLIELEDGLDANEAVRLGLVDSITESVGDAAARAGLPSVPAAIRDRPLVRFIEMIGANGMFSFLLVTIGLMALSGEMNAPGLGVPGFIAMMCFALFFWTKFLNGTAEWFELMVLLLGFVCIAIELFVVPGVGIFGVGGLFLTVLGIVLMSQTFIIPENEYQLAVLSRGVWTAIGGVMAMIVAFVAIRAYLPSVPLLGSLVMESVDTNYIEQHERLGDYEHLMDRIGVATTVMRPSGKADFDGQVVPVVSDGSVIERGEPVRVCEVNGTRVTVEPVQSETPNVVAHANRSEDQSGFPNPPANA